VVEQPFRKVVSAAVAAIQTMEGISLVEAVVGLAVQETLKLNITAAAAVHITKVQTNSLKPTSDLETGW
jgi:hypothetical protein